MSSSLPPRASRSFSASSRSASALVRGERATSRRLDTASPTLPLLVSIFGWFGEQERERLIERTKAGLGVREREGKLLASPVLLHAARDLMRVAAAARRKGVARLNLERLFLARAAA